MQQASERHTAPSVHAPQMIHTDTHHVQYLHTIFAFDATETTGANITSVARRVRKPKLSIERRALAFIHFHF